MTLYGSKEIAKALSADTPIINRYDPFLPDNPIIAQAPAAAELYLVNKPPKEGDLLAGGELTQARAVRIIADGVLTAWTEANFPVLALAKLIADVSLTPANRLGEVVVVNEGTVLTRRGDDIGAPGAGEFSLFDTGSGIELRTGTTYGEGTTIDVYIPLDADIVNESLTAGIPKQIASADFINSDVAAAIFADK